MSSTRRREKPPIINLDEVDQKPTKRVENSWTLLAKDDLLQNANFNILTLPHPSNGKPSKYCLDDEHKKIYEITIFDEPHRSWFIGEKVKSDGSIYITTPINPVFLVLPRLRDQCSNRAIPLEDLLSEKGFDCIIDFVPNLDQVADLKGPPDIKAYKYSEEKTLNWLKEKVFHLAKVLKEKKIHVRSGAVSATFVASEVDNEVVNEEFYFKYAFGILSEYLQEDLMEKLEKHFNFTPDLVETLAKKRKSDITVENTNSNKKVKNEPVLEECKENTVVSPTQNAIQKQKPLSAKEKARQKAASGTKTISSFFTKK